MMYLTAAHDTLDTLHALDALDFLQNTLKSVLRLNKRFLVRVRRPLEAPLTCNGVELHVRSNLCGDKISRTVIKNLKNEHLTSAILILLPPRRPIFLDDKAENEAERREGASETGINALAVDARKAMVKETRSILRRPLVQIKGRSGRFTH